MDSISLAELFEMEFAVKYMSLAAFCLAALDFLIILMTLFIRSDSVYGNMPYGRISKVLVLSLDIAFAAGAIISFASDSPWIPGVLSVLAGTLVFTVMLIWGIVQMNGVSAVSMEVLETVVGVIEAGDENLDGHSLHVQNLTMLIYDNLPLGIRKSINPINMQYASLLLDIGKHGIPRSIIDKKGKLLPEEKELIQRHPEICVKLLEGIPSFKNVATWVKYHHERVDGSGYHKLKGSEIPIESRILAVADTYSAMTMERSYKPSLTHEAAIAELRIVAGRQLDAAIVDIFCSIPAQKVAECMADAKLRMKKYEAGSFR